MKQQAKFLSIICTILIIMISATGCTLRASAHPLDWPENEHAAAVPAFLSAPDTFEEFSSDENDVPLKKPWVRLTFSKISYNDFRNYAAEFEKEGFGRNTIPEKKCEVAIYYGAAKGYTVRLSYYRTDKSMTLNIYSA